MTNRSLPCREHGNYAPLFDDGSAHPRNLCDFDYPDKIEHLVFVIFTNISIISWPRSPAMTRIFLLENNGNIA